jgi:protein-tyrosine phosphatase
MEESVSEVINGLWIGGEGSSASKQFFEKEGIEAVVNCTPSLQHNFMKMGIEYLRVPAGDSREQEDIDLMKEMLPLVVEWIRIHHKVMGKNVLVHCHQGINRSGTFVCAYLMKHYGMTFKEAVEFLIIRRQPIFYNGDRPTFKDVLEWWESSGI